MKNSILHFLWLLPNFMLQVVFYAYNHVVFVILFSTFTLVFFRITFSIAIQFYI